MDPNNGPGAPGNGRLLGRRTFGGSSAQRLRGPCSTSNRTAGAATQFQLHASWSRSGPAIGGDWLDDRAALAFPSGSNELDALGAPAQSATSAGAGSGCPLFVLVDRAEHQ